MTIDADRARKMLGTPALSEAVARACGRERETTILRRIQQWWPPPYASVAEYDPDYGRLCWEMHSALTRTDHVRSFSVDWESTQGVEDTHLFIPDPWTCFMTFSDRINTAAMGAGTLRDALILALAEAGLLKEGDMLHQHSPRPPFQKRREKEDEA